MKPNKRINRIGEYHFKELNDIKARLENEGKSIIDLGIGDPDLPIDEEILKALVDGFKVKNFNNYPPYEGILELKKAVVSYYDEIYGVKLLMDEVAILVGSKEGINNLIPALCDFSEYAIIPDPAYPVYGVCAKLWGVYTYKMPLKKENGFLPKFQEIPKEILEKTKFIMLNYPNNPTGAIANDGFYKDIVKYAYSKDIVLCNDGAYNEIVRHGERQISLMQYDTKKKCIEFGSFSKTFNMAGFRLGFVVGNRDVINAIVKIKSNVDSGQFIPIQLAGVKALSLDRRIVSKYNQIYEERRKVCENILSYKGFEFYRGGGTFYMWCNVPKGTDSKNFCQKLLNETGVLVTPGDVFGEFGRDYFRISLTTSKEILKEGLDKIKM